MTEPIRPALIRLAADPESSTKKRLWRAMTVEERRIGLEQFLAAEGTESEARKVLRSAVAKARHFRPQILDRWDDARLASAGCKLEPPDDDIAWQAIVALHLKERVRMLSVFLDAVGIAHKSGVFVDDEPAPPEETLLRNGAVTLLNQFDHSEVVLYLLGLRTGFEAFAALDSFLIELAAGKLVQESPLPQPAMAASEAVPSPIDVEGFTTLDRRLIVTIVDAAAGIVGAATLDELDDLILELEQLNGRRHQTFFHAGYRDSLFRRNAVVDLAAANEARRKWYWSGFINGLARREKWAAITELFDAEPAVRSLGEARDGPAAAAGLLVFRALTECGRVAESGRFARPAAVATSESFQDVVLATGIRLIRQNRAADARAFLDTLWIVYEELGDDIRDERIPFYTELKRRRALCLRQLGDTVEALRLLEELAESPNLMLRAIARTDIGLIRAHCRRLGELALPPHKRDLPTFIANLERGETDLRDAESYPGFQPAHASFALGVLELARENYDEAVQRLDLALSYFSTTPEVYRLDGTLPLAELYLGVSSCLALDETGRLPRACELIRSGLAGGATIPVWLVQSTVDSLEMMRGDLAHQTATAIFERLGEPVLDELLASAAAEDSPAIRAALFRRASDESRPVQMRVRDCRAVLPRLLVNRELDHARAALGYLEAQALEGVGRSEFALLLSDAAHYDPAWQADRATEARIRLSEADGNFDVAAHEIETVCYKLLASVDDTGLDEATLLLGRLEEYGPVAASNIAVLAPIIEARWEKLEAEAGELTGSSADDIGLGADLRILVVGGNEDQAKMDEDIQLKVASAFPRVRVEFLHTGWSGNWSAYADEFRRRVKNADGVVMLALMRTMLGRTIRAACGVPWRGCPSRGRQGAIIHAIGRVIPEARRHLVSEYARHGSSRSSARDVGSSQP